MRRLLPTPSMVVALLALVVALGGVGYAATSLPRNSVGTKQLKKGAVRGPDIAANAITGSKVRNRSLTGADLNVGRLGTVPAARHADAADTARTANTAGTAAPNGPAGGALAGSYPNPTLANGSVTPSKLSGVPTAIVTNSAGQGLGNLSFNTEVDDPLDMHSPTTNPDRITAPIAGVYTVQANVCFSPSATGERAIYFRRNGADVSFLQEAPNPAAGRATCVSASVSDRFAGGDYLQVITDAGAAVTVLAGRADLNVSMTWIAP